MPQLWPRSVVASRRTRRDLRYLAVDMLASLSDSALANRVVQRCLVTVVECHCSFARHDGNYFACITFCFEAPAEACMPQMVVLHAPGQPSHPALPRLIPIAWPPSPADSCCSSHVTFVASVSCCISLHTPRFAVSCSRLVDVALCMRSLLAIVTGSSSLLLSHTTMEAG